MPSQWMLLEISSLPHHRDCILKTTALYLKCWSFPIKEVYRSLWKMVWLLQQILATNIAYGSLEPGKNIYMTPWGDNLLMKMLEVRVRHVSEFFLSLSPLILGLYLSFLFTVTPPAFSVFFHSLNLFISNTYLNPHSENTLLEFTNFNCKDFSWRLSHSITLICWY